MKRRLWLGLALGLVVTALYIVRRPLQEVGVPFDPYVAALIAIPVVLLTLRKISLADMGIISLGSPAYGLFFVLLLPGILYLRLRLMGIPFELAPYASSLVIGSLAEEFFFRGYLQKDFEKDSNRAVSFILTNVLFTLVHIVKGYSLLPSLVIFVVGFYFSFARHEKGGGALVYPMAAHVLYNIVVSSMPRVGS
ncbi:MAG: CPBP family intramembrane metalloprotease [Candidatus Sungbacteria bacterium]|nr:CPBP family intramembrane metalloprotease [Candidatus Sungbacteria bacterium]